MIQPQATTATCKAQQVTLKLGEQSHVRSPNLLGLTYRATAPGITNATMTFKYGALTATSKSPASDTISRVYTFNILPAGLQLTSSQHSPPSRSSSQPGVLKLVP